MTEVVSCIINQYRKAMKVLLITPQKADIDYFQSLVDPELDVEMEYFPLVEPGEVIQRLSEEEPEVVIVVACKSVGNLGSLISLFDRFPNIAFITYCEHMQEAEALHLLSSGAQDFLVKGEITKTMFRKTLLSAIYRENMRIRLLDANKRAIEARQYSSRLLARMSHEIRTPLNAVIGMTEMLCDTELNSKQRYYTQLIREGGNMLTSLFNDLLDFAKIESGKVKIAKRPFLLRESMQEAMLSLMPAALEKKLDLILHLQSDLPKYIVSDDLRLRQVVMNLLDNAIKFTRHGHVQLRLWQETRNQNAVLLIAVSDTGPGIPGSAISNLFKPYTKLAEHEDAQIKGVGLGLSICDHLMKMMQGTIHVDSTLGQGSTFTLSLPLEPGDQQHMDEQDGALAGKKVLFLTHDSSLNALLKDYFDFWKAELSIQEVREEFPEVFDELSDYDLILTHLRTGFKLDLRLIDHFRKQGNIPHILLKDRDKATDEIVVIRKDTLILLKPIDTALLFEACKSVLIGDADSLNRREQFAVVDERLGEHNPLDILVAEDNVINQKIILGVLGRFGYSPKLVENGKEALASLDVKVYDLVLMDIQMPVMDGIEATRQIREKVPEKNHPRIIALTADALQQSKDEYVQIGLDDVLYKPVQTKELLRVLSETKRIPRVY